MAYAGIAALIPSYRPDGELSRVVEGLRAVGFSRIVVVDDGNGEAGRRFFEHLGEGVEVLRHAENRGKGAALKTGLAHIAKGGGWAVVTADADGQHAPSDCAKVADALSRSPESLILGVRDKSRMPSRSKAGNRITCMAVGLLFGLWVSDTQTGLRGLPASALARFARLRGDRYEYENTMLIAAKEAGMGVVEVGIETIYMEGNASSHFNAVKDSARIYRLLFDRFSMRRGVSLTSTAADWLAFAALCVALPGASPALPAFAGRGAGAAAFYTVRYTRGGVGGFLSFAFRFALLAALSWLSIAALESLGIGRFAAKAISDAALFAAHMAFLAPPGGDAAEDR